MSWNRNATPLTNSSLWSFHGVAKFRKIGEITNNMFEGLRMSIFVNMQVLQRLPVPIPIIYKKHVIYRFQEVGMHLIICPVLVLPHFMVGIVFNH